MAIYDVSALGTPNNKITFNNYLAYPIFRVIRRAPTRREIREYDIPLPESSGIADFQTFIGKEYFIIDGIMYPKDEPSFHAGRASLRKVASLDIEQSDSSSDGGYVPYSWDESGTGKQMFVKVLYVDMQEDTKQGIVQPFKILCKVKYPVILGLNPVTASLNTSTAITTGGATIPATIPMSIGASGQAGGNILPIVLPVVLGATSAQSGGTVTNAGDLPAWPSMVIYGPVNKPKITNTTTGEYFELDVQLPSTSDSLVITYDQDSLSVMLNGVNCYGKKTAGSTEFRVRPGINNFTLTGSSLGVGSYATVSFFPTWPIS